MGTARYTIPPTNKHAEQTDLQNHNEMLYPFQTNKYVYDGCTGGKTGYTNAANSTLVTYAERDGMTLICVVMNTQSPNQWLDSRNLFDYCFDNFQLFNIAENETNYTSAEQKMQAHSIQMNRLWILTKMQVSYFQRQRSFPMRRQKLSMTM